MNGDDDGTPHGLPNSSAGQQHRLELVLECVADRVADLERRRRIGIAGVEDAVARLRGGEPDQLGEVRHRRRVEAALAVPRERDAAAAVDGALDEEELARSLRARPVDRAGADERRRQRPGEQRLLELRLLRRVRRVSGLGRPLGLEDRHGQLRRLAALPVERPALVVGVDRGASR